MCALDPPGGFTSRMPRTLYVRPHATGTGASPEDPMDAAVGIPGVRGGGTVRLLDGSYLTNYTVRSLTATVEAADGHSPSLVYLPTGPAGVTVDLPATTTTVTLDRASDLTTAAAVGGLTLLLESGTYTGTFTPAANTVIQSAPGHHAVIDGGFVLSNSGCTLRDLEVRNSSTARGAARLTSASATSTNSSIINCVLLDGGLGVFATGSGLVFQGCITNGQGWQAPGGADRGHGHSAYIQNHDAAARQTIADNIFGPGFGWSAHAYSESVGRLTKMDWLRNTAWGAGALTIDPHETYTFLLAGSVAASDYTLSDNYLYGHYPQTKFNTESSNLISGSGGRVEGTGYTYRAPGAYASEWTNSTWVSPVWAPGTLGVYVHANAHETGRANITVFNPNSLTSTTADCTGIIGASDPWYLYDGFNPLAGPVSSGTGPTVTVPMTGLTCRTPAGCSAPTHPCPKFGAFVVRSTATWVAPPASQHH